MAILNQFYLKGTSHNKVYSVLIFMHISTSVGLNPNIMNFELTRIQVHPPKPNFKLTRTPSKSPNFEPIQPEIGQTGKFGKTKH